MGLLSAFRNWRTSLTNTDRQQIWRMFGSFTANKLILEQGNSLIQHSYERNTDVYAVIKKIVDITKAIPWIVEEKKGNEWVVMENNTISTIMANPNATKGYTWNDIEEMLLVYLLVTGNAYVYGESQFNNALIEELDVLPSESICIESNRDFFLPIYKYEFRFDGKQRDIDKEKIAHLKLFNPKYSTVKESLYGLSPIQVAAVVVQTGNDRWDADAAILQNRGVFGMITDKSQRPMLPEEAAKVQEDFNSQVGGLHKQGSVKVTNKDLGFIQMAMSSTDLQLIEKGVVNLRAICNVFGLDSSLFNDPENKTYNNRLEAEKAMYTNAIIPISDKISEQLTRFIAWNHYPNKNVRMRQDFSKIQVLQENFKEKAETYSRLKTDGIITANDVAKALSLPISTDENADKLIIGGTNMLVSSLNAPATPPPTN